jgi:hypothetical protein
MQPMGGKIIGFGNSNRGEGQQQQQALNNLQK